MKKIISSLSTLILVLSVSACGTSTPYQCTSLSQEICNLQKRMVRLEDKHMIPRAEIPAARMITDEELIEEIRRRKLVKTYAAPGND